MPFTQQNNTNIHTTEKIMLDTSIIPVSRKRKFEKEE